MEESEWLSCTDPRRMHPFAYGRASERKLRLFACACCRRVWKELVDERSRQAVLIAERYADGLATAEELDLAAHEAWAAWDMERRAPPGGRMLDEFAALLLSSAAAYNVAIPLGWWGGAPAFVAPYAIILDATLDPEVEGKCQCVILQDLVGNPFGAPPALAPALLQWNDGTLKRLAEEAYEERLLPEGTLDLGRLAVLADALEETGVTDPEILAHLRNPGPHYRGCHILDLLLGKE